MKRKYLYIAGASVIAVAVVVSGIVALNKDDGKSPMSDQANSTSKDDQVQSVKSDDIKTPTNNDELANTLNEDASSFDTDLKNYENNDYNDSSLTDDSLYN